MKKEALPAPWRNEPANLNRLIEGTLFLDEIGDMPLEMQVKILRAIQEREIEPIGSKTTIKTDVRIIAATNRNLETELMKGRFRSDLYYRLNVFPIEIPPLRDRKEDLPALVSYFLERHAQKNRKKNTNDIGRRSEITE